MLWKWWIKQYNTFLTTLQSESYTYSGGFANGGYGDENRVENLRVMHTAASGERLLCA